MVSQPRPWRLRPDDRWPHQFRSIRYEGHSIVILIAIDIYIFMILIFDNNANDDDDDDDEDNDIYFYN